MDKIRVLIADDNEAMRLIERKMIEKVEGFDLVGEARDGLECIELVEKLRPQIVFSTLKCPARRAWRLPVSFRTWIPPSS